MGKMFDSNFEPAKPSQIIFEILRQAIQEKRVVINDDNNVSVFIAHNQSVADDIDAFVERYHQNGGSTIAINQENSIDNE